MAISRKIWKWFIWNNKTARKNILYKKKQNYLIAYISTTSTSHRILWKFFWIFSKGKIFWRYHNLHELTSALYLHFPSFILWLFWLQNKQPASLKFKRGFSFPFECGDDAFTCYYFYNWPLRTLAYPSSSCSFW